MTKDWNSIVNVYNECLKRFEATNGFENIPENTGKFLALSALRNAFTVGLSHRLEIDRVIMKIEDFTKWYNKIQLLLVKAETTNNIFSQIKIER